MLNVVLGGGMLKVVSRWWYVEGHVEVVVC